MSHRLRGRKDHYLPQTYLRGFVPPNGSKEQRPLWLFQAHDKKWKRCSTSEIGFIHGFYDYSRGIDGSVQSADDTFADLERNYRLIVRDLNVNNFSNWTSHKEFLLRFMQMIRSRSPLYFEQKFRDYKAKPAWRVEEISDDNAAFKVKQIELENHFIKNRTLIDMTDEIAKGADWLNRFDWALRYTDSIEECFFTSNNPFVVIGPREDQHDPVSWDAIEDPETLLLFPICWRACLLGSQRSFDVKYDRVAPGLVQLFRDLHRNNPIKYAVSPIMLKGFE